MARVAYLARDSVPAAGGPACDRIEAAWGRIPRPLRLVLHNPEFAACVSELMQTIHAQTTLDEATRELVILTVARLTDSQFEWTYHERSAASRGISKATIEAIKQRRFAALGPGQRTIVTYAEQVAGNKVADDAFDSVAQKLGRRGAVELTVTIGFYVMLCQTGNALGLELPEDVKPLLTAEPGSAPC